jgi:hypothetical protein
MVFVNTKLVSDIKGSREMRELENRVVVTILVTIQGEISQTRLE